MILTKKIIKIKLFKLFLTALLVFSITCSSARKYKNNVNLFDINVNLKRYKYTEFMKAFYSRDFVKFINLYEKGRSENYADILAARAYLEIKEYNRAFSALQKALRKLPKIKGFIYYLFGLVFERQRKYLKCYKYFLNVDTSSAYYEKARKKAYKAMDINKKYKEIININDKANLSITGYYKAKAYFKLRKMNDFEKQIRKICGQLPYFLYKPVVKLWIKASKPSLDKTTLHRLSYYALISGLPREALKIINEITNPTLEMLDLKASIYLKIYAANAAKNIYSKIMKTNNALKYKAEYMYYRCTAFLRNIKKYVYGMKNIIKNKNHPYRSNALKVLILHYLKKGYIKYDLIHELAKYNTVQITYFYSLLNNMKKKSRTRIIHLIKEYLKFTSNHKFKAFLYNFLGELYLRHNRNIAYKYYRNSAVLSSNFYANLSYLRLKNAGKANETLHTDIATILKVQKQNPSSKMKTVLQKLKDAPDFESEKCDIFLEMGDKLNARRIVEKYLSKNGVHHILSVIKYFINKNFLPVPSELTLRLRNYLYSSGFNNTFYSDIRKIAFPDVFNNLFKNVKSPVFLKALVFGESFFHVFAYSHAGAIGYCQKMPKTARWILKNKNTPIHVIFNPDLNITLGDKFISWLLKKYKSPVYALTAYNAGPGRLRRYLRRYRKRVLTQADFVRHIPLAETRNYIRKVLNAYVYLLITR